VFEVGISDQGVEGAVHCFLRTYGPRCRASACAWRMSTSMQCLRAAPRKVRKFAPMALRIGLLYTASEFADA